MNRSKLDPTLQLAYEAYVDQSNPDASSSMMVVLYHDGDRAAIENSGFRASWWGSEDAIGELRFSDLGAITDVDSVVRIVAGQTRQPTLDTAAPGARARAADVPKIGIDGLWHVRQPDGQLSTSDPGSGRQGASGKGVIVGVIDTGIDVTHPSFATRVDTPNWETRILKLWDQGLTAEAGESGPPASSVLSGVTYGVEFESNDINDAINTSLWPVLLVDFRHRDCIGHGTHVTAIACGGNVVSGGSDASYVGIAPEADIIVVKLLDVPDDIENVNGTPLGPDTRFRDAVIYILREASAAGKPVVINASFGNPYESGDGLGDSDRFLDETFDPAATASDTRFPSRAVFVTSAGNSGDDSKRHFATVTIPDSGEIIVPIELYDDRGVVNRTVRNCKPVPHVPTVVLAAWYRKIASPEPEVAVKTPLLGSTFSTNVSTGGFWTEGFDNGKRFNISHDSLTVNRPDPAGGTVSVTRRRIFITIEPKDRPAPDVPLHLHGIYEVRFKGAPGTVFYVTGSRTVNSAGWMGLRVATAYHDGSPLPGPEVVNGSPTPIELIDTGTTHTIADSAGRHVITVAAYDDSNDDLAYFSSRGPLRDYTSAGLGPLVDKPDLAAPGMDVNAALSIDTTEGIGRIVTRGGVEGNRFIPKQGTSMASPVVAGIVALMLEKNPDLNIDQVRTALHAAAKPGSNPAPADPDYGTAFGAGRAAALESHTNTPPP